jgi:hypothetical protein
MGRYELKQMEVFVRVQVIVLHVGLVLLLVILKHVLDEGRLVDTPHVQLNTTQQALGPERRTRMFWLV